MYETAFTPWASLGGGVLIGLAAVLLMLVLGRVMGATGILAGVFAPASTYDFSWRAALLAGHDHGSGGLLARHRRDARGDSCRPRRRC